MGALSGLSSARGECSSSKTSYKQSQAALCSPICMHLDLVMGGFINFSLVDTSPSCFFPGFIYIQDS